MKEIVKKISFKEFHFNELENEDKNLLLKAEKATGTSYSPYSHFKVGASILLEDGTVIDASNQENAAYPSGLCAERVALFYAGANHPDKKIISLAVTAKSNEINLDEPVTPCGACRQVMLEYEEKQKQNFSVLLKGESEKVYKMEKASDLLPLSFEGEHLKK